MIEIALAALVLIAVLADSRREEDSGPVWVICPHCYKDFNVRVYALHERTHGHRS